MSLKTIENYALKVTGRVFKLATVRDEPYACLADAEGFIARLKPACQGIDVLTFMQGIAEREPKHAYPVDWESLAVVPVSNYEHWLKKQINDKTRNMVRKSAKAGVEFRISELDEAFVKGVTAIYNEVPVRQGKPFTHYGKDAATIGRDLATFPGKSTFVGAYLNGEMIGFIKIVESEGAASLMHILSLVGHRDKAPTNGLVAKAVEICAERKIPFLHYSVWSRRGLGDFKRHHGFLEHRVPRYYVPLTFKGRVMLALRLHRPFTELIPEKWLDAMEPLRAKWSSLRAPKRAMA
ncbi:MAG: hypothetical protein RLY20_907 [Verrucomicrobiota bacterium]